jgi:hypothetical protein
METMETEINKLNCSYCNKPYIEELWCIECDPFRIMEGWTSGNPIVDKCIKDTMYKTEFDLFLEWVPFDRFADIEKIGEGGFSEVYSAMWLDGKSWYSYGFNGIQQKEETEKPLKVALKKLIGSQNISERYINEVRFYIIIISNLFILFIH